MSYFQEIPSAPDDPILGLAAAFKVDPRENRINLGVGTYKDSNGHPVILSSVRKAEKRILDLESDKEYLPIVGSEEFCKETVELIFGKAPELEVAVLQTLGGSGALRLAGEFLAEYATDTISIGTPAWANHLPLFSQGGLKIHRHPYYSEKKHEIDFLGMADSLSTLPAHTAVLLQTCCHNPTGYDLTTDDWDELSELMLKRSLIPVFDSAYQGFGTDLEQDVAAIRTFAKRGHEMLICHSFSKNMGLYGERVGALLAITPQAASARSQLKRLVRSNYSTPPRHGSLIVTTVLGDPSLKMEWQEEVKNMRERIQEMRSGLANALQATGGATDFEFMHRQRGMFSLCGLIPEQVDLLKVEHGIYMPSNGRINVAGLNATNLPAVTQAIQAVLHQPSR
jgi:aspartate aminotransferase